MTVPLAQGTPCWGQFHLLRQRQAFRYYALLRCKTFRRLTQGVLNISNFISVLMADQAVKADSVFED